MAGIIEAGECLARLHDSLVYVDARLADELINTSPDRDRSHDAQRAALKADMSALQFKRGKKQDVRSTPSNSEVQAAPTAAEVQAAEVKAAPSRLKFERVATRVEPAASGLTRLLPVGQAPEMEMVGAPPGTKMLELKVFFREFQRRVRADTGGRWAIPAKAASGPAMLSARVPGSATVIQVIEFVVTMYNRELIKAVNAAANTEAMARSLTASSLGARRATVRSAGVLDVVEPLPKPGGMEDVELLPSDPSMYELRMAEDDGTIDTDLRMEHAPQKKIEIYNYDTFAIVLSDKAASGAHAVVSLGGASAAPPRNAEKSSGGLRSSWGAVRPSGTSQSMSDLQTARRRGAESPTAGDGDKGGVGGGAGAGGDATCPDGGASQGGGRRELIKVNLVTLAGGGSQYIVIEYHPEKVIAELIAEVCRKRGLGSSHVYELRDSNDKPLPFPENTPLKSVDRAVLFGDIKLCTRSYARSKSETRVKGSPKALLTGIAAGVTSNTSGSSSSSLGSSEYRVIKINKHGKRQERIMGIDRDRITNKNPNARVFSSVKRRWRDVAELQDVRKLEEPLLFSVHYKGENQEHRFEAASPQEAVDIVQRLTHVMQQ